MVLSDSSQLGRSLGLTACLLESNNLLLSKTQPWLYSNMILTGGDSYIYIYQYQVHIFHGVTCWCIHV